MAYFEVSAERNTHVEAPFAHLAAMWAKKQLADEEDE
jgi:hypothetical protein